ncbi:hypothetical protein L6467_00265 [Segatella bryantii]|jgi:hypothetical protein|uniref:hypothetical protein n=1 Tax=Segatella bryantii TaxID=77095 RepID=UPI001EDB2A3F|nr:hypothetical protein [Segatella bryantii]UKK72331.1 hypothetical protein L6467_00265 [Segatella bryantii]UKK74862.1 hypothetical protein L6471_03940 [Segatella bryantii]
MKDLSIEELEVMLCSTGYLPPRCEDELMFFNQMYEDYKSHLENRHVDVDSIINGTCRIESDFSYDIGYSDEMSTMVAEDDSHYSMAARNYSKLPKDILDKMKKQHKPKDDED